MKFKTIFFIAVVLMSFGMGMRQAYAEEMIRATISTDVLNVRASSDESAAILSKLSKGQEVMILGSEGDWANVRLDNGLEGYVSNLYLEVQGPRVGQINALGVNLRISPTSESKSIGIVNTGDSLQVINPDGEWAKVQLNGMDGYVYRKYITIDGLDNPVSRGMSRDVAGLVELAKTLQGKPYVYGSNGPNSFDCSGFVRYVYKNAVGIDLPRVSRDQARFGAFVGKNDLLPGDIVSFDTNGGLNGVTHVGIFIGDGNFIHASSDRVMKVKIDSINSNYYSKVFMGGSRVLQ